MNFQTLFFEPQARSCSSSCKHQVTDSLAYVLSAKKLSFKCSSSSPSPFMVESVSPFSNPQSISFNSTSFNIGCPLSNSTISDPEQHVTGSPLTSFAPSSPDSTTFSDISSFNDESHLMTSTGSGSTFFSSSDLYFNQSRNSSFASSSCLSSFSCFSNANDDHPLMYDDLETYQEENFSESQKCLTIPKRSSQKDFEEKPQNSNKNLISSLTASLKLFSKTLISNPSVSRTLEFNSSKPDSHSVLNEKSSPVPLKTFKVENTTLIENWDATTVELVNSAMMANDSPASGQRSARASPLFLRMYAIGNSSQQKNLIPNIFDLDESYEDEIQQENDFFYEEEDSIDQLDDAENSSLNQYTYYKLGMKAKLKLYDNIKLQPRSDSPSENSLRKVKYIKDIYSFQNTSSNSAGAASGTTGKSLVELSERDFFQTHPVVPWILYDDIVSLNSSRKQYILNTHGVLRSRHSLLNSMDTMKRNKSHVQFTVKGYVNPRWVSSSYSISD